MLAESLLEAFAEAGAREVILEALTVNEPAISLYEGLGFYVRRRLIGFDRLAGRRVDHGDAVGRGARRRTSSPASWQLGRVLATARRQADPVRVPAVVPERHPVARLCWSRASSGHRPSSSRWRTRSR